MIMKMIPFLKWAGGKRWLVYRDDLGLFDVKYDRYVEPFLGGGSVFFKLLPNSAVLSDANSELMLVYKAIKNNWEIIQQKLLFHQKKHSVDYYYKIRKTIMKNNVDRAARFIYLNRTCWNGLYRVNCNGEFNVPIGTKVKVVMETDDFRTVSRALRKTKLLCCDFEKIIDRTIEGDFLFVDPPYTVRHSNNGFVKYNEKIFKWEDQERLCESLSKANRRKVKILMTNAAHEEIEKMYKKIGLKCQMIKRTSLIAGKASVRGMYNEFIIKNY